jgi:Holliday junction resolvase RusA-like endonuclease
VGGKGMITFTVPGEPQGKGRPKIVKIGGFSRMATPQKTVAYEGLIAHIAAQAMAGRPPMECPCRLDVEIVCSVPASWSQRKQREALEGSVWPAKKPDTDNILKALNDGMNGVVWRDDVQAVEGGWRKVYGATPGLRVTVRPMVSPQADLLPVAA